jgi:hypothetical protein
MISPVRVAIMLGVVQWPSMGRRVDTVPSLALILIFDLAHFGGRVSILSWKHDSLGIRVFILADVILVNRGVSGIRPGILGDGRPFVGVGRPVRG